MKALHEAEIQIRARRGGALLNGDLAVPTRASGLVIFAHGSGSSRKSPRNQEVAEALRDEGMGTLLFDLLTEAESQDRRNVFDVGLLAERLLDATNWVRENLAPNDLQLGYFGASTGAAAALVAAALSPASISAVVSRGGRPDLANGYLARVTAPTLLIVGGNDFDVIPLNQRAYAQLACPKRLEIVSGATHLFEEPGAMNAVTQLAAEWFQFHFTIDSDGGAR